MPMAKNQSAKEPAELPPLTDIQQQLMAYCIA